MRGPDTIVARVPADRWLSAVRRGRPAILEGLLDDDRLSLEELARRWPACPVPVAPIVDGVADYSSSGGIPFRAVPLGEVVAGLGEPGTGMVSARPEDHLPGIAPRLPRLPEVPGVRWRRARLWVSPAGAITPLHREATHNLLAQLEGRKDVVLYDPWQHRAMYANPLWSRMPQMSRVAAHAPDPIAHPRFLRARPLRASLRPGDVLFIPRLHWHWVTAVDDSLSYNQLFAGRLTALVARGLEAYKRMRALKL